MVERSEADNAHQNEELVLAITDALLAGEKADIGEISARYGVSPGQVRRYAQLVEQLHRALVGIRPSTGFVKALQRDLLGEYPGRWRWLALRAPLFLAFVALAGALITAFVQRWRRQAAAADPANAGE